MKQTISLLTIIVLISCSQNQTDNTSIAGWSLVYKHSKQGEQLYGSKEKVIEAVRSGLSVKVGYGMQGKNRSIEHVAEAQFLTILTIKDTLEVFAQISPIMRQGRFRLKDTVGIKLAPGYKWLTAIGTNDMCSNVMVNTFKDTIDGSNENRRAANWFVEYPSNFEPEDRSLF